MEIIIDTSGILDVVRFKADPLHIIDKSEGYPSFIVPSGVLNEIREIAKNRGRRGALAKASLVVIKSLKHVVVKSTGRVDDFIVRYAKEKGNVGVLTNDIGLKRRLFREGVVIFSIREKSYIERV